MTSEVKKVVPKRFTSRFTVSKTVRKINGKGKVEPIDRAKSRNKSVQVVFFSDFPSLPTPSMDLQKILVKFNQDQIEGNLWKSNTNMSLRKNKSRWKKTRCLNAFIAFRSFYSRSISNVEQQRQLSKLLGELWKNEPNQAIWNRYAIEYNSLSVNQEFVDWLLTALGLDLQSFTIPCTSTVKNENWEFSSRNNENSVEDVYYIGSI